jgi:hypothetical protein
MSELVVDAPIVAVTVYPDRARVTRRGKITVPAGDQTVYVEPLPLALQEDSVRVSGRGPATVLGVDLAMRHHPQAPDETVAELERQRREAQAEVAELTDADDVQAQLDTFLAQLARRAGGSFARTLASGETRRRAGRVHRVARRPAVRRTGDATGARHAAARSRGASRRRRPPACRGRAATHARPPFRRRRTGLGDPRPRWRSSCRTSCPRAGWTSSYDVRLTGDQLTLSWYGLITQRTGEDWPECDLTLSTARPTVTAKVPELDPWYLDRFHPPVPAPALRCCR